MYKLFTLVVIFLLATINLYSQRDDRNRGENQNSYRITSVEREPVRTPLITYHKNPVRETQEDNEKILYPKNSINPVSEEKSFPIEGVCIVEPIVSSHLPYTLPLMTSLDVALQSFKLGDYYEASLKFTDWLVYNSDDINVLFYRGICYYKMEWFGYAIDDFDIVIKLDWEHAQAYYYRGISRLLRNEKVTAGIDLETAYELGIKTAGTILKKYFW